MHCYICDKLLTEAEIKYLPQSNDLDCCGTCFEIAMETAYCDGFIREEPLEEIDVQEEEGLL